jgi:hypothetical protein
MDYVKSLGKSLCDLTKQCVCTCRGFFSSYVKFMIVLVGVLDDGIPALRMYSKQDDRVGLSIPTTANAKAIIKQVKRVLQVALHVLLCYTLLCRNFSPFPICIYRILVGKKKAASFKNFSVLDWLDPVTEPDMCALDSVSKSGPIRRTSWHDSD